MFDDLAALRLQLEWGADEAIGEQPINRLAASAPTPTPARINAPVPAPVPVPVPVAAISQAGSLAELQAELEAFHGCRLRLTATTTVRPLLPVEATVLLLAEAPSADDDRSGNAFSGSAADTLARLLAPTDLSSASFGAAALVPWRPPGGRRPSDAEIAQCLPFLHRLLVLARPERVLMLGGLVAKTLAGSDAGPRRRSGQWVKLQIPGNIATISALQLPPFDQWLRSPGNKAELWRAVRTLLSTATKL